MDCTDESEKPDVACESNSTEPHPQGECAVRRQYFAFHSEITIPRKESSIHYNLVMTTNPSPELPSAVDVGWSSHCRSLHSPPVQYCPPPPPE